jgi:hypothetical protein
MNTHDALPRIADLLDKATRLRSETKAFTYNELVPDDIGTQELAELWVTSQEWVTAARAVEAVVATELAARFSESHSNVEASGYLVWLGVRKVEECVDPVGFITWLEENPSEIGKAFNPNTARKGSLPPAVRDTFFEKRRVGEPRMQAVPVEMLNR